jgi:hypothetical protein
MYSGGEIMKKETLIKHDIRMYPSDWEKFKDLKIKSDLPWPSFIKMVNRIIEKGDSNTNN